MAVAKKGEFCRCVHMSHNKVCNNTPILSCQTCGGCMVCKGCAEKHHPKHSIGEFVQQ